MTEKSPTKAELSERLEQVEAERDEYLADLKRVAAEFENYRKRALRDQESLVARAHERLVKELLPVLDDLERALEAAAEHEEAKLEEGVRLVHRELRDALAKEGLVEIETNGSFDPHVHEALLTQPYAEERFKEVQGAYDVLSDPEKRKQYDQVGPRLYSGAGAPGGGNFQWSGNVGDLGDLSDLFGGLFGQMGGGGTSARARPRGQRGADVEVAINVSFEDSLEGLTTKIPVELETACPACNGSGAEPGTTPTICPECRGRGVTAEDEGFFAFSRPCPRCGGNGTVVEKPCRQCGGSRRQRRGKGHTGKNSARGPRGTPNPPQGKGEGGVC